MFSCLVRAKFLDYRSTLDECAICREKITPHDTIERCPNSHSFHENCICEWMRIQKTCPICRQDVRIICPPRPPTPIPLEESSSDSDSDSDSEELDSDEELEREFERELERVLEEEDITVYRGKPIDF